VRTYAAAMPGCMGVLTGVQIDRIRTFRCYNHFTCIAQGYVLNTSLPRWLCVLATV
jgi:hypothetical protein